MQPAAGIPLLDMNYLRDNFLDHDLVDLLGEMMRTYGDSAAESIDRMNKIAGADFEEIKILAHTLKGSSGTIGAARMASLAARLEQAARAEDVGAVEECISSAQQALSQTLEELNALLHA